MRRILWGVALASLCLASRTSGQAEAAKPRPKIGIALAGGSALGMAHIGVLKWFEERHIPIEFVSGTSMGGLVGGCYATGMTPDEMAALLKSVDWNEALGGATPYDTLTFRRRQDQRDLPTRLEVGLRGGLKLPAGLDPAHPIGLLLSRVSLAYATVSSFDALPIPFRCMATDMDKGVAIALKDGSLATALRATMAIPAVFTPVERDGKLLTDGGTLNNVPTEAAKAMGADIVIAVELFSPFSDGKRFKSLVEILGQVQAISVYNNERRSLQLADVIVTPDLTGLNSADFGKADEFIARGYKAAEAKSALLSRLAVSEAEWQAYLARRNARKRQPLATPAFVETAGVDARQATALSARLEPLVGARLNLRRLEKELTAITGAGRYESFQYEATRRNDKDGLLIRAHEKKYGPPFLKFGFEVNGADTDNVRFNLAARLIDLDAGSPNAETRTDLRLGSDRDLAFEYYRLLDGKRWFLAPRLFYLDNSQSLFQERARVATYRARAAGAGLDLGYNTGQQSELRLGYQYYREQASVRTGSPALPSLAGDVSAVSLRWGYDGLNSPMIPTKGTSVTAAANWYLNAPGVSRPFTTAELRLNHFHPLTSRSFVFGAVGVGATFGADAAPAQQFTLGGPLRLGAYPQDAFRGDDYLLLSTGYLTRLAQLPSFLGGKVLLGGWCEFGGAFKSFGSARYRTSLSIGLIAETLLGPVILGGSYGEYGQRNLYFSFGRLF